MSNELHIDKPQVPQQVDAGIKTGITLPATIESLEKYGGPAGSFVYRLNDDVYFTDKKQLDMITSYISFRKNLDIKSE
jgi:hypothetical protein